MTDEQLRAGSLFSGAGLLDLAIEEVFGARTVWNSDIEPGPRKVLAHRFPGVPNLGDITRIDWRTPEWVHIISGGSPCQDISGAGRRAGMTDGTRSNLWVEMREAAATLNPHLVIWENVRGATSARADSAMELGPRRVGGKHRGPALRALGRVLGDLADLGYDTVWHGLRAADVGAPHGRFRVFVVAANTRGQAWLQRAGLRPSEPGRVGWGRPDHDAGDAGETRPLACPECGHAEAAHRFYSECTGTAQQPDCICTRTPGQFALDLLPTPSAGNFNAGEDPDQWEARRQRVKATANNGNGMGMPLGIAVQLLPTPMAADSRNGRQSTAANPRCNRDTLSDTAHKGDWGRYAAAIARWETIVGPAPAPTKPGRTGRPKLNPAFAEWMMGAPAGWITDVPGITDTQALRLAGNGVVPQQAAHAIQLCLNQIRNWSQP